MTSTEERIFEKATALPVDKRQDFLDKECANDDFLRNRINVLLAAHESENGILDLAVTAAVNCENLGIAEGQDIGPYRLLQQIGEGGFGVVFMAEQRKPVQRKVAVKIIKPGMDSKAVVARFEGERQALAMMDHPNIARVFDGGTSQAGQRPYFVMELVQGVPITEFCDGNSLTTKQRLELFISVCNAVHHAHLKGIIHRDIKPSNVMVTLHDGKPIVKVIDFGVAKALHQRLTEKTLFTHYGTMVGTPQYMSPEQAEMTGLDVDTRSDVYSLAVLLYELVTGTTPIETDAWQKAGLREIQRMICQDEAVRPSLRLSSSGKKLTMLAKHRSVAPARLSREVQGDLDWIVMKGLEKERTRRYDSAKELAADVECALNHQPVSAGPPSIIYRARKFVLRNRTKLAFAAAFAAVIAAITFGLVNHWNHQLASIRKDEIRLNNAIDEANATVLAAVDSTSSNELWKAADRMVSQVKQIVKESDVNQASLSRAEQFLERYQNERQDKDFLFSMEELVINKSTDQSIESLKFMEQEFRRILRDRDYDLDKLSPNELAAKLKLDRSPLKVTDALELWLSLRMKLSDAGANEITSDEVARWVEAMCSADPVPMRTAIRKTVFGTVPPSKKFLDDGIKSVDLTTACPRKLSWLAEAYLMVDHPERSDEIREFALGQHPGDLMLNYENAAHLMEGEEFSQAIRYLMRCTAIRPRNSGVWKTLGDAYGLNGEFAKAVKSTKKAIEQNPNNADLYLQLSHWLLRDDRPQAAIEAAETALSLDQNLPLAWRAIGQAHMKRQDYVHALVAFENFREHAAQNDSRVIEDWIRECRRRISAQDN